jgi:hypothetical protein
MFKCRPQTTLFHHPHPDLGRFHVDAEPRRPDPTHSFDCCSPCQHYSTLTPPLVAANYPGHLCLEGEQPCMPLSLPSSANAERKIPHLARSSHHRLAPPGATAPHRPSSSVTRLHQLLSHYPTTKNPMPSSSPPSRPPRHP